MAKKSFLLVSLNENKAKKIAEVINNKTCRKILDYLTNKKDATESQMAKDLKIPLSTVHYNMKALMTARLVKSDEYHYSTKGKEVSHYRLANQYVIIAPEGDKHLIREKLKSIIPAALIMGFTAGAIKFFSSLSGTLKMAASPTMFKAMEAGVTEEIEYAGAKMITDQTVSASVPEAMEAATNTVPPTVQHVVERAPEVASNAPEIALWFFIGAISGITVYLLVDYIVKRIKNR